MNIKDTKLYKTRGIKGLKQLLYFDYPFKFVALSALVAILIFKIPDNMIYLKVLGMTLALISIAIYIHRTFLVIKFVKSEKEIKYNKVSSTDG